MKQSEVTKATNSIADEMHRLTLDIIELKRATFSLRYLNDFDDEYLKEIFKKLEKIIDILLDL